MSSELIISLILLHDSTNILEKKKTKDEFLNLNINLVKKKDFDGRRRDSNSGVKNYKY